MQVTMVFIFKQLSGVPFNREPRVTLVYYKTKIWRDGKRKMLISVWLMMCPIYPDTNDCHDYSELCCVVGTAEMHPLCVKVISNMKCSATKSPDYSTQWLDWEPHVEPQLMQCKYICLLVWLVNSAQSSWAAGTTAHLTMQIILGHFRGRIHQKEPLTGLQLVGLPFISMSGGFRKSQSRPLL